MKKVELLAPAGNFECLEAACRHGADAVYVGAGTFNLRVHSENFQIDELPEAIELAHGLGSRLYIVANIMPSDEIIEQIEPFLRSLACLPQLPDGIIISDPGVLQLCRELVPAIPRHLSTQTGTFNRRSASFWVSQGISRIILPRELTLAQVNAIARSGLCQTEVFIHGAMCVSISGRCLLGAYLSSRHANYGDCPQPCRLSYTVTPEFGGEENNREKPPTFSAEEDSRGVFLFNSRDLNALPILPQLLATGVDSVKIEGRNKSVHYIASVVKVYRAALDRYFLDPESYVPDPEWDAQLDAVDHRSYTTGFYTQEYRMQDYTRFKTPIGVRLVGVVKDLLDEGRVVVDVKNPFAAGEQLSVLPVNRKKESYTVEIREIKDCSGNLVDVARTNRVVVVSTIPRLSVGDIIRRIALQPSKTTRGETNETGNAEDLR